MGSVRNAAVALLLFGAACAGRAEVPADTLKVETLATPHGAHWVYLMDVSFPHLSEGKIVVVDADRREVLGMMTTGFLAGLAPAPDRKELYVTETFYSRGVRGERTDVVTIYDPAELKPVGEVVIPPKRFIALTMPYGTVVTRDGRFLLQYNFTPATSVSVVDLKSRRFVGEIDAPGCTMIYPGAGNRRYSMICSDGRLLTHTLDDEGRLASQRMSEQPFFDPDKDSLNVAPARLGDTLYFVSFLGQVHPLDVSGQEPAAAPTWSLLKAADRRQAWRPGGWQYVAANEKLGRLYVIMHPNGRNGTHKDPGGEIWVYDLKTKARIQRIRTKTPVVSVLTSRDDAPLLYALGAEGSLHVYDARRGRYRGTVAGAAETAMVMVNP